MILAMPKMIIWWITLLAFSNPTNSACTCVVSGAEPPPSEIAVPYALEGADAVFLGQVMSGRVLEGIPFIRREFTFSVTEQWKGEESASITIRTGVGDSDCGYRFQLGQHYLVYATQGKQGTEYEGFLYTGICSRTGDARENQVKADLAVLRASD